jgi:hypothetical protein
MNPAYLLWAQTEPTPDNWDDLPLRALAEWSDSLPTLFLLLIGAEPAPCAWPVFRRDPQPQALTCPWPAAAQRLRQLQAWVAQAGNAATGTALLQQLDRVAAAFAEATDGLLVLDVSLLQQPTLGRRYDKPAYRKAMEQLRSEATAIARELSAGPDGVPRGGPALQRLLARPVPECGHWGAEVADGFWLDPAEHPEALPEFLAEFDGYWYGDGESAADYDPKLGAYLVRRCRPGEPDEHGIATAYGRWLVPLGPHHLSTNRYDDAATRAWIELRLPRGEPSAAGHHAREACGLLDANGMQVFAPDFVHLSTVGDRLVFCQRPDAPTGPDGEATYELRRIDTGEVIEQGLSGNLFPARGDGHIEAERAGEGPDRKALLTLDGRRVTEFAFGSFTPFHKKLKVAGAVRDGKVGLIDTHGRVVLPMVYDRLSMKTGDGPPHFHGDRLLVFTVERDAAGNTVHASDRVGIADAQGRVIVPPSMHPWHLQWAFDKNGCMLVYQDDTMYHLNADGTLSAPLGSRQATLDEMKRQFDQRWQRPQAADEAMLAAQVDRDACNELIGLLCRDRKDTAASLQARLTAWLDEALAGSSRDREDEHGDEAGVETPESIYTKPGDGPATPFFRALAYALRDEAVWMHLDWKAADELPHAAAHLPDITALKTFQWDGLAHGEDMHDGFDAMAAHLQRAGWRLIGFDTEGDDYLVGAVAEVDADRCLALAQSLQVPIRPLGDGAC